MKFTELKSTSDSQKRAAYDQQQGASSHWPTANEARLLLLLLRTTGERLLVLNGHFHPKLLTATEVVRFLVFILFLVKGSIWLVFGHTPTVLLEHER